MKDKLSKLIVLSKNKELIKEAVEVYLNQSSSFTSLNSSYESSMFSYWTKEKEVINRELVELERNNYFSIEEKESRTKELKEQLDRTNQHLERTNLERQAFEGQKKKNEKIVRECKELLRELE